MVSIYDPHMTLQFVDKSIPEPTFETPALDTSLAVLIAGFPSKGLDNKITEIRRSGDLYTKFGDDFGNFKKYGQANLVALGAARSKARVFFIRLLPDNAKRSYVTFGVSVKEKNDIPVYERSDTKYTADRTAVEVYGEGPYVLTDKLEKIPMMIKSSISVQDPDTPVTISGAVLKLTERTLQDDDFDSEGRPLLFNGEPIVTGNTPGVDKETFYPLFTLWYFARGKGGNDFSFKIERDSSRDKITSDGRRYILNIYEQLSKGTVSPIYPEPFYFSFNPDARFSPESPVAEGLSVIYANQDKNGESVRIQMENYDDSYKTLINDLSKFKLASEAETDIDFMYCLNKKGNPYHKLVLDPLSFDFKNGVTPLKYGTDGSFELGANIGGNIVTEESIAKEKEALLIKFFKCDIDEDILDEKITDIDVLPDCNYPPSVKKTILKDFSYYRPDIALRMDLGLTYNYRDALKTLPEYTNYVNSDFSFMCSFNGSAGVLTDPSIGSPHKVTYTYDYIRNMADGFATGFGAFQMYAGVNRGKVKYFRPFWVCKKSKANYIEKFEELGLNYIEAINKYGDLMYGSESSQYPIKNSKMSSDRNALVIGRAMRVCHGVLINYKYDERSAAETLGAAESSCNNALRAANIPGTIKITTRVYQTNLDKLSENAHCDIVFEFPDYIKKFIVTIYANRPKSIEG